MDFDSPTERDTERSCVVDETTPAFGWICPPTLDEWRVAIEEIHATELTLAKQALADAEALNARLNRAARDLYEPPQVFSLQNYRNYAFPTATFIAVTTCGSDSIGITSTGVRYDFGIGHTAAGPCMCEWCWGRGVLR